MKKLKILTVVGTRPELIKLSEVIGRFESDAAVSHVLVHTGQNYDYELNQVFFDDLNIRQPDFFLGLGGESATKTIGNILISIDPILEQEMPDALLVLGDTNSSLSVIAAKKRQIPIFHMEAGNRCFDQRVPEETNRRIVDVVSDINLTYSQISRDYLISENFPPDRVIKVGCPVAEVLSAHQDEILKSNVIEDCGLKKENYFVVSVHREENVDDAHNFSEFQKVLNILATTYEKPVIVSCHPRTRIKFEQSGFQLNRLVELKKPFGFFDYIHLQQNALAVLSDSGTISEEASILGIPAINLRQSHERPEAMEEGAAILTGFNSDRILQALNVLLKGPLKLKPKIVSDYDVNNVSEKVLRIILSYTDYVNRNVWKKN